MSDALEVIFAEFRSMRRERDEAREVARMLLDYAKQGAYSNEVEEVVERCAWLRETPGGGEGDGDDA